MRIRSRLMAAAGVAMIAMTVAQAGAQAAPKGWKCSYKVEPIAGPFLRDTGPYYYACYGPSLNETRAQARARCGRLANCTTGACLPLDYTPRRECGRD